MPSLTILLAGVDIFCGAVCSFSIIVDVLQYCGVTDPLIGWSYSSRLLLCHCAPVRSKEDGLCGCVCGCVCW